MKNVEVRTEGVTGTPMTRYKIYYKGTLIRTQLSKPDEEDLVWFVNKWMVDDTRPANELALTGAMGKATSESLLRARTRGMEKINGKRMKE